MEGLEHLPPDFVRTFTRQVKMLKYIGINIFADKKKSFLETQARLIFFSCFLVPMLAGQILYVMWSHKTGASFRDVVNAIPSTFMVLQDFVKIFVAASKREQIREVILEIGGMWPTDISGEKKKVLRSWTRRLKYFDNAYFTYAVFSLTVFEMVPLVVTVYSLSSDRMTHYEFPVQVYFFCWLESNFQYALAYTYFLFACTSIHLCIYISCDFLLVDLTYDVCALLSLLQIDLKKIAEATDTTGDNLDDHCDDIREIVGIHQKLLRLTKRLDEIFSAVIFTQLSFSSVVICCFGFLTAISDGMLARHLTAVFAIMFAIYILAWPGQLLADTSAGVGKAAYECLWYDRGVKFRKYIAIILTKAQNPCYLTALGFSDLTLANFSKMADLLYLFATFIIISTQIIILSGGSSAYSPYARTCPQLQNSFARWLTNFIVIISLLKYGRFVGTKYIMVVSFFTQANVSRQGDVVLVRSRIDTHLELTLVNYLTAY